MDKSELRAQARAFLAKRFRAADRRKAPLGAVFFGVSAELPAPFGAPDVLIVAACSRCVISLAQVSRSEGSRTNHRNLVYSGEISFHLYMASVPCRGLLANLVSKLRRLHVEQLLRSTQIILAGTLAPVAVITDHLVDGLAKERMKLWRSLPPWRRLAAIPPR